MTVGELLRQLQAMPHDAPVVVVHNSVRIPLSFVELRVPPRGKPIVFIRTAKPS